MRQHCHAHVVEGLNAHAFHGRRLPAFLNAKLRGLRIGKRFGKFGRGLIRAHHSESRIDHNCQEKVHQGACGHHRNALSNRLFREGPALEFSFGQAMLLRLILLHALIEHRDVTAERNGRNSPLAAAFVSALVEHLAKADAKSQYLDAAPARDDVVPPFVHKHENGERNQKTDHCHRCCNGLNPTKKKACVHDSFSEKNHAAGI